MQAVGIVLAVLFVAALVLMHRRDRHALRTERGKLFDACHALFDCQRITQESVAWPVLAGTYGGFDVHIAPLVDDIVFRKVPSLWLLVTVKRALPIAGAVDMLARAQNTEFYSPADGLPVPVATPHEWPRQMTIKADRPAADLPLAALDPHVRAFFADPRAKEMLVTRQGVRIVYQAQAAERSEYLVLRRAVFRDARLPAALVGSLLDQAVQVCAAVMKGDVHGHA